MRRLPFLVFLLAAACATAPAPPPVDEATRTMITQLEAANVKRPAYAPYVYLLAMQNARARDEAAVLKWLTRLDELKWDQGVNPVHFRNTRMRAVRNALAAVAARQPLVTRAQRAFTLAGGRDLVPEGIAYDEANDVFYVTSIHRRKVIRVQRDGTFSDFTAEGQDGMLGGLGLKIDAQRRLLWVISSTTPEMRGWSKDVSGSMLAAYDLRDGRLVKKIDAAPAILNDLALMKDGSLLATDMGRHTVVRLAPDASALEVWAEGLGFPNGITLSDDERFFFVADFNGVTRFDVSDKSRKPVESSSYIGGIDGLSMHRGALIGIQSAIGNPRVIRIDPATGAVTLLESKNPLFELPTTGAFAKDAYYFIANPGLRSFDEDHNIWPASKLQEPVMLRLPLE